jgi:hypothetical protein
MTTCQQILKGEGNRNRPVTLKFSSVAAVKAQPPMMGRSDR